jgi:hypothetical protein
VVKVNGVTKTIVSDYTISATGLITFGSAPANGHAITVTGEFDVPVRFDIGQGEPLPISVNEANIVQIDRFTLREVIGTAELCLMRDYNITPTAVRLFLARLVKITRLDGVVLRIAEAETSITVAGDTFTPLPGCTISAVRHIINGEMPSMEIKFAHSVGGVIDTEDLNSGAWDGAVVVAYLIDRNSLSTLGDALFTGTIQPLTIDPIGGAGSFDIRGLAAQAESIIQTYQPMCRTDLFSPLCQLVKTDFDQTGTVGTIIDRFNVTIAGLAVTSGGRLV